MSRSKETNCDDQSGSIRVDTGHTAVSSVAQNFTSRKGIHVSSWKAYLGRFWRENASIESSAKVDTSPSLFLVATRR